MEPVVSSRPIFRFGLFEADTARGTLTRDGVRVKIQDQPFRVLILLLENPGEIVTREELRRELWPEGTYVDFDGSLNVILKKLRAAIEDDSDNPRFIATIPRRGYRFIAPVTVQNGAISAAVTHDVTLHSGHQARKTGEDAAPPSTGKTQERITLAVYAMAALFVLALVGAGSFALYRWARKSGSSSRASAGLDAVPVRKSIAVLGFHNASGRPEDDWLGPAISEMLRTELAEGEKLRLISGEDVSNLHLASPWPMTDTLDPKTTDRIGTALNSNLLVLGSYTVIGGPESRRLRLDARLQEAQTGEILSEVAETGGSQDLFLIVSRVGAVLRDRLGIPALAEAEEAGVRASVPLDQDAARFYVLGLAKLRDSDASAAKDLLQQATEAAPKSSLAHAMLARAYSQLGYEQKRKEEAKKAWELSNNLPRSERMLVEGDYYESVADHEKAISTYRALFELFPDNVDYGLQLASVQILAGHGTEALETLRRLRQLPSPASDDPRIDLAQSRAIPDNKPASLLLVRDAMHTAKAQGKRLVFAQARKEECRLLAYTEHPDLANASCQEAYDIFLSAGNRLSAADSLRLIGDVEGTEGHFTQAVATYKEALQILQALGEHEKTGAVLNNMAINFVNEGRLDEAESLYRQAKAHFDEAGDEAHSSTALANIADVRYLRGDLKGAEGLYKQSLDLKASIQPVETAYQLYRLADLELAEGRVQDARLHAEQAITAYRAEQGSYQYLTGAMIVLGEALQAAGDLEGARQQFEQTLDIRKKSGEMELVAESETELAALTMDEGDAKQAETLLRPAITEFENERVDPAAADAYALLGRALAAQGRIDDARAALRRALELSSAASGPASKLDLAIQSARVEIAGAGHGASGRTGIASARQQLRSVIETAKKLGYYQIECQGRLALDELETQEDPAAGAAHLTALAQEAHSHGLELLARQAEQVLSAPRFGSVVQKPTR
jgi:DNA-binding winged helix-turn-helix (wHTH) protein/tetratricopeptide (TPR) repeat protein